MRIFEPFSVRQRKRERAGKPVVYQYDDLPNPFRVQVAHILRRALGPYERPELQPNYPVTSGNFWRRVHGQVVRRMGVFTLLEKSDLEADLMNYFLNTDTENAIDIIDFSFHELDGRDCHDMYRHLDEDFRYERQMYLDPDDAIAELNYWFKQHDIGYQFQAGELIIMTDEVLHNDVVEPAIHLLYEHGFEGALQEFMSAHRHYRKGENPDAIVDANNAFESTMQTISKKLGVTLTGNETADQLIKHMTDMLGISPTIRAQYGPLKNVLNALPVIRNNSGGHGQGEAIREVADRTAAYAVHLAAANIVYLIESWKAVERSKGK